MKPYQAAKPHAMIDELIECTTDYAMANGRLSLEERKHRAALKDKANRRIAKYILGLIKAKK